MDRQRRRFIPTSDDLEVRKLLSTTSGSSIFGSTANTNTLDLALTFQNKEQRVERLPHYIRSLQPNRFLPESTVSQIQAGLTQVEGVLHKPGTAELNTFNLTLRKIVPSVSLTSGNARKLHQAFVQVMQATGAPQGAIDQLSSSLNQLASRIDTASVMPVYLATNDYTLVLQTALSIGKPLPIPQVPQIAVNTGIQANRTHSKTTEARPYFSGTYVRGTVIQIVNAQGDVLGQAATNKLGQYRVRISAPLSPGTYSFFARIEDQGHFSRLSHEFFVRVDPHKK